jgi:DNA polymerase bacteriophage-type
MSVEFEYFVNELITSDLRKRAGEPGRLPHAPKKPKSKPPAPILPPAPPPSAPPVTYAPQPDAPTLFCDVETRSTASIDVGAHRYAAHPTTEVLCIAYAVDDGPVKIWRLGEPVPQVFFEAARDPRWRVVAHNAEFERAIMRHVLVPRHGFPIIPTKRWRCTMAMSLAAALPGALENVAAALNLPHRKDIEGHHLMLRMCKPLYVEVDTGKPVWLEGAEHIERLCQYCACDVDVERALFERLPPLSDEEQRVWRLDQRINKRGFHVDRELAQAARAIAEREQEAINDEINTLTGGEITSAGQTARIIERVRENGHQIASLQKRSVSAVLAHDPDDETRRLLELRREGSRASTRKFNSLFTGLDVDNRLRGTMRYHAAAPGRWSGRAFQPQNLKKVEVVEDFDAAIAAVLAGDMNLIRAIGSPPTVIGDLMRSTICAAPDHTLIGGDFSAIEARVLAWIAGEQWKVDNFREYDRIGDPTLEPYCATASKILRRPITPDDKAERTVGKTAELACGFGGSVGAWRRFAKDDERDDEAILADVKAWRAAHPATTRFWYGLERAAKGAVFTRQWTQHGKIRCELVGGALYLTLPSGRRIAYPEVRLGPGKFPGTTQIIYKDNARGDWKDERAWYGTLVENVVQGIARDLLAAAMLRLEHAGFPIVLHVHDEVVCEVREGCADTAKFIEIMTALPDWAAGLPIAAKAWTGSRYIKGE